jgi:AraC family transcriptional regulator
MIALDAICGALDYIEAHLQSPVSVADMAAAVGYSVYHFCRVFNQVTHHTPYDYLVRRRLAEAAGALVRHSPREVTVLDVALDYGFSSPETFSRAFRRVYGLSPREARMVGCVDAWRTMPRLTRAHLTHLHKGTYLRPAMEERAALRVVGVMTLLYGRATGEQTAALWAWLDDELVAIGEPLCSGARYGIAYYATGWEARGYSYMAGVGDVVGDAERPGLATQVLPAGQWARFVHKGPTHDMGLTLDYLFHTWLPRSRCTLAQPLVVEHLFEGVQQADLAAGERAILVPVLQEGKRS